MLKEVKLDFTIPLDYELTEEELTMVLDKAGDLVLKNAINLVNYEVQQFYHIRQKKMH